MTAAQDLQRVTNPDVPPLGALDDPDAEIRLNAALALAYNGDAAQQLAAVPVLVDNLGHESTVVRLVHVVGALAHVGTPALPVLLPLLDRLESSGRVRSSAAAAVLRIAPAYAAPAVAVLAEVLRHGGEPERGAAARILREIRGAALPAVPALLAALADDQEAPGVRCSVAWALVTCGAPPEQIVPALVMALNVTHETEGMWSASRSVGWWAAYALEELGPTAEAAAPGLLACLADPTQPADVRVQAAFALAAIVGAGAGSVSGGQTQARAEAPRTVPELRPRIVAALGKALHHPEWWVRVNAARALAKLAGDTSNIQAPASEASEMVAALVAALADSNQNVQRQAILALSRLEARAADAVPALAVLLDREPLAGIAAEALAKIGAASLPALTAALGSGDAVRRYAAYGLHKLATAEAQAAPAAAGADPIKPDLAHFYPIVPAAEFSPAQRQSFEALFREALAGLPGGVIDYALPAPKHEFLRYVVTEKGCMVHGSNRTDIDVLRPVRQSTDSGRHGNQNAVYADPDWLRPIYFAIVDRRRVSGLSNGFRDVREGPDNTVVARWYHFAINADSLRHEPWTDAMIYVLPGDAFEEQGEWVSRHPVRPLLKLPVSPQDFPFLEDIRGADWRLGVNNIRLDQFPWLDEAARYVIRRRR